MTADLPGVYIALTRLVHYIRRLAVGKASCVHALTLLGETVQYSVEKKCYMVLYLDIFKWYHLHTKHTSGVKNYKYQREPIVYLHTKEEQ